MLQPLIGLSPVDSIYTPVEKVNYYVENTRVGQNTDFDKLTVEVWTNGTKTADEAISLSAKIINDHMMLFIQLTDEAMNVETMVEKEETKKEKILDMTIEELQEAILEKMRKNGPVTDYMVGTVRENKHQGSLINWVKSFN